MVSKIGTDFSPELKTPQNLNFCSLTVFPPVITKSYLLKQLDITGNSIEFISAEIKELKDLEVFLFANNSIAGFPIQLMEMRKLSRISYRQKCSYSLSSILSLFFKIHSSSLKLSSSKIEALPSELPFNSDIETLILTSNA